MAGQTFRVQLKESVFAEENVEEIAEDKVAAKDKIAFDLTLDYFGKYIWRGQNLSDNSVFQPGLSIGYRSPRRLSNGIRSSTS